MKQMVNSDTLPFILPESVVNFLQETFPGDMEIMNCLPLEGDASDRAYFRLSVKPAGSKQPQSFILMQLANPWIPDNFSGELPFVNIARHLAEKGIAVPGVLVDAADMGMILLEDVGDVTLENYLQQCSPKERKRSYQQALEILVRLQKEASSISGRPCHALSYAFDARTFFRELCFFREHALEGLWGHRIPEAHGQEMEAHFWNLCQNICDYPQVFTHRDYHARNLMVQSGRLVVLDFQDARLGPVTYDLVSLLRDSYVNLEQEEQQALITYYRKQCRATGVLLPDRETFQAAFNRTGLQRNLKAIGTFAYQAVVKKVDRYLPVIPNTVASIRLALESDPELTPLGHLLQMYMKGL